MDRRRNKTRPSDKHLFNLVPLTRNSRSLPSRVSFAPIKIKNNPESSRKKYRRLSSIPQFNLDRKFYTPCFQLPRKMSLAEQQEYFEHFKCKVRNSLEEIQASDILVPRPRLGGNSLCSVCRGYYDDYLEHIMSKIHKQSIKKSKFMNDILDLVKKMQPPEQTEELKKLRKSLKRQRSQVFQQDFEQESRFQKKTVSMQFLQVSEKVSSRRSTGWQVTGEQVRGPD